MILEHLGERHGMNPMPGENIPCFYKVAPQLQVCVQPLLINYSILRVQSIVVSCYIPNIFFLLIRMCVFQLNNVKYSKYENVTMFKNHLLYIIIYIIQLQLFNSCYIYIQLQFFFLMTKHMLNDANSMYSNYMTAEVFPFSVRPLPPRSPACQGEPPHGGRPARSSWSSGDQKRQ